MMRKFKSAPKPKPIRLTKLSVHDPARDSVVADRTGGFDVLDCEVNRICASQFDTREEAQAWVADRVSGLQG